MRRKVPNPPEAEHNRALGSRRVAEMAAMFMIGDGLLGLLGLFQPDRHVALWRSEVRAVDVLVAPFEKRRGRRQIYGAFQVAAGLLLASRSGRPAN